MIVLCRHGATQSNLEGLFLSYTDLPLDPEGRRQAEALRAVLAPLALRHCYVSPMLRCLQTRELAAPDIPFAVEPLLREIDFGAWEGRTPQWIAHNDPEALARRARAPVSFRPPNGESFEDVAARLPPVVARLRAESDVLVVGHRGTLGVLERLLRGLPLNSRDVRPLEPAEYRVL